MSKCKHSCAPAQRSQRRALRWRPRHTALVAWRRTPVQELGDALAYQPLFTDLKLLDLQHARQVGGRPRCSTPRPLRAVARRAVLCLQGSCGCGSRRQLCHHFHSHLQLLDDPYLLAKFKSEIADKRR